MLIVLLNSHSVLILSTCKLYVYVISILICKVRFVIFETKILVNICKIRYRNKQNVSKISIRVSQLL